MKVNMSVEQLKATFDKYDDEYIHFQNVANKRSRRPDMHAFIVLDELLPGDGKGDLISAAEHDQFFLDIEPEALARVATEEIILDLVRCGVFFDEENESLFLFT
jgi:hypothetical protein